MMPEKIKIAVIDDCVIFRTGLRCVLSNVPGFEIISCGDFEFEETLGFIDPPDVILAHTTVKDVENQTKILIKARTAAPCAKVLLISEFSDMEYLAKILMSGCDGYVLRDVSEKSLVRAITNISTEIFVFERSVISKFLQSRRLDSRLGDAGDLSSRESRVIEMIAEGMTNGKIASELCLAVGTVKNIVSGLLLRFGCQKRSQLVNLLTELK
ncbi:MAG: response regulator transcription factor [Synergistaceae bacterium]|jgi:DNA-binding NarL/FixJ family response regulator|nr:response regulator transcription factor [Synergistaceae bacterium]